MANINVSLPTDGTTADVSDYNTPIQTIVDDYNGNVDNSNIAPAAAIAGTKLASGSVGATQLATGAVTDTKVADGIPVQVVSTNFSAVATGTTLVPEDDTKPQNTEGTEFMTREITPKSTTNRLHITVKAFLSQSAATNDVVGALFQDSTADALAAQSLTMPGVSGMVNMVIEHDMLAGTTSATTFKFRSGPVNAATLTFNGFGGARKFGGISLSSITIIEYKAS